MGELPRPLEWLSQGPFYGTRQCRLEDGGLGSGRSGRLSACKALGSAQQPALPDGPQASMTSRVLIQYMLAPMDQALRWALGDNGDHYRYCSHSHRAQSQREDRSDKHDIFVSRQILCAAMGSAEPTG